MGNDFFLQFVNTLLHKTSHCLFTKDRKDFLTFGFKLAVVDVVSQNSNLSKLKIKKSIG